MKLDLHPDQLLGSWTLVERVAGPGGLWRCRCTCGVVGVVTGSALASGRSRSCGCVPAAKIEARFERDFCRQLKRNLGYIEWRLEHGRTENYTAASWSWQLAPLTKILKHAMYLEAAEFVRIYGVTPTRLHSLANQIGLRIKTVGYHPAAKLAIERYAETVREARMKGILPATPPPPATNTIHPSSKQAGAQ